MKMNAKQIVNVCHCQRAKCGMPTISLMKQVERGKFSNDFV